MKENLRLKEVDTASRTRRPAYCQCKESEWIRGEEKGVHLQG